MDRAVVPLRKSLSGRMLLFGVLPTVAVLLGLIVWLASAMYSALRVENEQAMALLADSVAAEIERGNTRAVLMAEVMAFAQQNGLFGDRAASTAYARRMLAEYTELTGAYFGYEPDAETISAIAAEEATMLRKPFSTRALKEAVAVALELPASTDYETAD